MNRWRVLTIGSTDVTLHPSIFAFLLYTYFTGHFTFSLLAFCSIFLHEVGHGIMSTLCGRAPAHIEITPLGAVMRLEDVNRLSFCKRILTVLAGPAVTLLLCLLSTWMAKAGLISRALGGELFLCNLAILLMNLLPFFPLDGGRLLHLVLELFLSRALVTKIVKAIGYSGGILLIFINVYISWKYGGWNLSLAFAGCCIIYNASTFTLTQTMAELRCFIDRKIYLERRRILRTMNYAALHTTPLRKLIRMLPANRSAFFLCIEFGTQRIRGAMHESEIIQRYLKDPALTLGEALDLSDNSFKISKSGTI